MQECMADDAFKLRVEGVGSVSVQPDRADVALGYFNEGTELQTVQAENARVMNTIIRNLKRIGVPAKDMVTLSYTINPQYDYIEGKQVFRGYRVTHTLKITIREKNRIGEIIDTAVESGANIVSDIRFSVSNSSGYYRQALSLAIDNALAKAMTIGNKMNVTISPTPLRIIEKSVEQVTAPEPTLYKAAGETTPIQIGQTIITARIEAVFTYS